MKVLRWVFVILGFFGVFVIGLFVYFRQVTMDRNPGFEVDLTIDGHPEGMLEAGFSKVSITPQILDRWTDKNGDARYVPDDGDTYQDINGNGQFDPVWIAGFQNQRPAQGVHDELWARAVVLGDGSNKFGLVVLDAIGFGADDAIAVRKSIPDDLGLGYTVITSTHTHQAPDLIGLWGPGLLHSGVDPAYRRFVQDQATSALILAAQRMRPARLRIAQDLKGAAELVEDSRQPIVMDPGIRLIQAVDVENDSTLGVIFNWANHPETLWSRNLLLSSDFPHYVREGMEKGVYNGDSLVLPGLGGITLFVNGAIGGLMTTSPDFGIKDPFEDTIYTQASYHKTEAQGLRLARLGLESLSDSTRVLNLDKASLRLRAKTFLIPMDNPLYRLASLTKVIDRGYSGWMKIRTEVCFWRLGPPFGNPFQG